MSEVFLDTSFCVAVTVLSDRHHAVALRLAQELHEAGTRLVTTQSVLAEIGDAFARPPYRKAAVSLLSSLLDDEAVTVLPIQHELFNRGYTLFVQRADKTWGITDCISFVAMWERGITEALTADRHFDQAGFRALLLG
jgi:hypothetical protein